MTINEELLPKERKKNGFDIVTVLFLFMFVFTFICCYLYTMRLEVEVDHQKKEIAELQAKIEQEKKGFEDIKKLRKNIIELKNDIVFYNIGGQEIFGELPRPMTKILIDAFFFSKIIAASLPRLSL